MELENLVYITVLLFMVYAIYNNSLENFSDNRKECSQEAISDAYVSYVFGTPYFVRPG